MRSKTNANVPMPDAEKAFDELIKTAKGQAQYQALVRLIAQVLDASVSGEDCNMRIGTTKNKSALIVTLYLDGEAMYATAQDFLGLLSAVEALL